MDSEVILEHAEKIAKKIGQDIFRKFSDRSDIQIFFTSPKNIVTNIDIRAEQQIRELILKKFPNHIVYGEESVEEIMVKTGQTLEELCSEGYCWLIDPLDGTSNFVNQIPIVGVSLALMFNGKRQIGVIYDVCRKETFSAVRGQGAYLNGDPIRVSSKEKFIESVMAVSYPGSEEWEPFRNAYEFFQKNIRAVRRLGSSTIEQVWVACGRLDGIFKANLHAWDVAAGSLIMEEAGAIVQCSESEDGLDYSPFSDSLAASNPLLFKQLVTFCRKSR